MPSLSAQIPADVSAAGARENLASHGDAAIARRPRPPGRLQLSAAGPMSATASSPVALGALLPSPLSPISANPCVPMATARKRRTCMGGFLCFSANYPQYCESKTNDPEVEKPAAEPSVQQGPTQVLSFLYVGSQADALDEEVIHRHGITHILNVSSSCPQSRHVPADNFLRISVNDGYIDRLLPHFQQAFHFLENVRETSGRCLVHCLAGISRSPTLSIAYIMKHKKLSHEDAYKFVKERRTNISPNFNFLGQLLEFEKQLKRSESFSETTSPADADDCWEAKRQRTTAAGVAGSGLSSSHSQPAGFLRPPPPPPLPTAAQSPTTALSRLSFTPCVTSTAPAASAAASTGGTVHLPDFPGTSLEQVAVTPCRSAALVAASASAPPTPPPPPPPPRSSSRRVAPQFASPAAAAAAAAAAAKSQSENYLDDDRNFAATFAVAAAAAAAGAMSGVEGRSRSLENLDVCTAGGSLKSLSSSASNGSHGSQEILTYS